MAVQQWSKGAYGTVPLDGLRFHCAGVDAGAMGKGNWSVGVIADERASAAQREAITAIASGAAGGPMAALSGLVGDVPGRRMSRPDWDRPTRCRPGPSTASQLVDMAAKGAMGINPFGD